MSTFSALRRIVFALATLCLTVHPSTYGGTSEQPRGLKMTKSTTRLQGMFTEVRTVCFGRFLIEIPATATLVYGPAEAETEINFYKNRGGMVAELVAKRLTEIEEGRRSFSKMRLQEMPLLGSLIEGARPGQKIVIDASGGAGYKVLSYIPIDEDLFIQHMDGVLPGDDVIPELNTLAKHLRRRADNEVPAESGMCIEGGFMPLDLEHERATIGVRFKEFPDVHLSVDAHKNQGILQETGRLELMREEAKQAAERAGLGHVYARTKILRHQPRQIGNWKGVEVSVRRPVYLKDTDSHEFRFQSLGAKHDALEPELDIRFETGMKGNERARAKSSLTDEEALMLWDRLINTIRVRQPGDGTPSTAKPVQVPLGTILKTSEPCTQAGLWRCLEQHQTNAPEPRRFGIGDAMPYALVPNERGLWQKLNGTPPMRRVPTQWELVAYVDDPLRGRSP